MECQKLSSLDRLATEKLNANRQNTGKSQGMHLLFLPWVTAAAVKPLSISIVQLQLQSKVNKFSFPKEKVLLQN